MTTYTAKIRWSRGEDRFTGNKYSRVHTWAFDGGAVVTASSSPHVVPVPYSSAEAIDPEEAFVASLSSCHMLWFLHLAAKRGFVVEQYEDSAEGVMARNESGKLAMTEVSLYPKAIFAGDLQPNASDIEQLHHAAHEECFIANSVKSKVQVVIR
ncbi:MAG: OsmC family protein [Burkholderiales bacterium]